MSPLRNGRAVVGCLADSDGARRCHLAANGRAQDREARGVGVGEDGGGGRVVVADVAVGGVGGTGEGVA